MDRRQVARRVFGRFFPWVQLGLLRARRFSRNQGDEFAREFVRRHGAIVGRGPFEGLRFVDAAIGGPQALVPKLIGSYECEIYEARSIRAA